METCTFLAFADLHHHPGVFYPDKEWRLEEIFARSVEENAEFIVGLGDYVHDPDNNKAFAERMMDAPKDLYCCIGNHDTDSWTLERMLPLYGMPHNYYYFDRSGYRFIVLDANYVCNNGEYLHYNPGVVRTSSVGVMPPEQIAWLARTIEETDNPCILLSHHSIERTDGILNRGEVWDVICRANQKRRYAVILYINGHYHRDHCTIVNDVCCLELNSASYQYIDPPYTKYSQEALATAAALPHTLNFSRPLSAMITLDGPSRIQIRGCDGTFMFGITDEDVLEVDVRRLSYSRRSVPYIRNYTVDLETETVMRHERE